MYNNELREKNPELYDKYFDDFCELHEDNPLISFGYNVDKLEILDKDGQKYLVAEYHRSGINNQSGNPVHEHDGRFIYGYEPCYESSSHTSIASLDKDNELTGEIAIIYSGSHEEFIPKDGMPYNFPYKDKENYISVYLHDKNGNKEASFYATYYDFHNVADRSQILEVLQNGIKKGKSKGLEEMKQIAADFIVPNEIDAVYRRQEEKRQKIKHIGKLRKSADRTLVKAVESLEKKIKNKTAKKGLKKLRNGLADTDLGNKVAKGVAGTLITGALGVGMAFGINSLSEKIQENKEDIKDKTEQRVKDSNLQEDTDVCNIKIVNPENIVTERKEVGPKYLIGDTKIIVPEKYMENTISKRTNYGNSTYQFIEDIDMDKIFYKMTQDGILNNIVKGLKSVDIDAEFDEGSKERDKTIENNISLYGRIPGEHIRIETNDKAKDYLIKIFSSASGSFGFSIDKITEEEMHEYLPKNKKDKLDAMKNLMADRPVVVECSYFENPHNYIVEKSIDKETGEVINRKYENDIRDRTAPVKIFMATRNALDKAKGNPGQ